MAYLIDPRVWDDVAFCALTEGAQLTWFAMLFGPQRRPLPGLFRAGPAAIAETRHRPVAQIETEMAQLVAARMIEFDPICNVVRVPNAPRFASAPNPNVLRSWYRQWEEVPNCALKYAHIAALQPCVLHANAGDAVREQWAVSFGAVLAQIEAQGHSLESYCQGLAARSRVPAEQLHLAEIGNGGRRVQ